MEMVTLYKRTLCLVLVYMALRVLQQYLDISTLGITRSRKHVPVLVPVLVEYVNKDRNPNDFKCHYFNDNGYLPELDHRVMFPTDTIFLVDTSCKVITSRVACSIESAARVFPHRDIILLTTSPKNPSNTIIEALAHLNNTTMFRIRLEKFAQGTPLDKKFEHPLHFEDLNIDLHEIIKFLTMYKYSGVYMNAGVIVARQFNLSKSNWIAKENEGVVSPDIFSFSDNVNGRAMAQVALNIIVNELATIEGDSKNRLDSDFVMSQFVASWCGGTDIVKLNTSTCQDLAVGSPENFFPIPFSKKQNYFRPVRVDKFKDQLIYTYPTWETYTRKYPIKNNSLLIKLAKTYCPMTYRFYGERFGKMKREGNKFMTY